MEDYIPENNIVVLFLLLVFTCGLYYFWWVARVSKFFGDNPAMNVVLIILTGGLWLIYINLRYINKSEIINGRDAQWYMILFLPLAPLIVQNNINEKYFPGR